MPLGISSQIVDNLPDLPGVYIFYGSSGMPLYVGKSVNIKERVKSHFSSDHSSSLEMKISQQIESIEAITTAGELGALLKESRIIKELQPLYNRQLRYPRRLIILKKSAKTKPYQTIVFEETEHIDPEDMEDVISVFKSKRDAEHFLIDLAKEHDLCEKLLGLEKGKGACFGHRLGKCKGACLGKEDPLKYNLRLAEAISKNKIKPWPFKSAITIEENNGFNNKTDYFIFDKWCYLGKVESEDEACNICKEEDIIFDVDTYKILKRYLLTAGKTRRIKQISLDNLKLESLPSFLRN